MKKVLSDAQATELEIFAKAGYVPAKNLIKATKALEAGNQEEALRIILVNLCEEFIHNKQPY